MVGLNFSACSCPRAECFESVLSSCLGQCKTTWNSRQMLHQSWRACLWLIFTTQKQAGTGRFFTVGFICSIKQVICYSAIGKMVRCTEQKHVSVPLWNHLDLILFFTIFSLSISFFGMFLATKISNHLICQS